MFRRKNSISATPFAFALPASLALRISLIALAGALLAGQSSMGRNVLLIIADDLGTTNVGVYGESETAPPTPVLDRLSTFGIRFRHCWSMPTCSPTRAALLTGRYGFRTDIMQNVEEDSPIALSLDEVTIPEVVASVDYATGWFGKWHLSNDLNGGHDGPNQAGFDRYAGGFTGAVADYYNWKKIVDGEAIQTTNYATTETVDDALDWIGEQEQAWLCCVSFNAPHFPFQAPPDNLHSFDLTGLDPDVEPIPFYHAMIEAMDREIGRLLVALQGDGSLQDTLVIFLGDNGVDPDVAEPPCIPPKVKGTP